VAAARLGPDALWGELAATYGSWHVHL